MSFTLRDELASRLFVARATAHDTLSESDARNMASATLDAAQTFCEVVCAERGHEMGLVEWLEGTGPTRQGQGSGAPRGLYECKRCGKQEEKATQR